MCKMKPLEGITAGTLFVALVCVIVGYAWGMHEASKAADICADMFQESADQNVTLMVVLESVKQHMDDMKWANGLQNTGLAVFALTYLILLFFAESFQFTPRILKGLLWLAAVIAFLGGARSIGYGDVRGVVHIGVGFLCIVPNRLLVQKRLYLYSYIGIVMVALMLCFVWSALKMHRDGVAFTYYVVRYLNLFLTLGCAMIMSALLSYRKSSEGDRLLKGLTLYRFAWILLLFLSYSVMAVSTISYSRHNQRVINEGYERLEQPLSVRALQ